MECKPLSCRAVVGDDNPPYLSELQRILDDFIPALRKLICEGFVQNTVMQRDGQEQFLESKSTKSGGKPSALKSEGETVKITIKDLNYVVVNGERIRAEGPANALLALAALADSETGPLKINTNDFVQLSYRTQNDVSKNWNKNKNWLEENGVTVKMIQHRQWSLNGFQIVFDPEVDRQKIKLHLQTLPSRVRKKRVGTS
jgi:hypothetical protein